LWGGEALGFFLVCSAIEFLEEPCYYQLLSISIIPFAALDEGSVGKKYRL
jgi:hypothetical protein